MSKRNYPKIDSDEEDFQNHQSHYRSCNITSPSKLQSPSKQPWKNSSRMNSLGNSQMNVTQPKVCKPKYTLPSQSCSRQKQELKHTICQLEESISKKNNRIKQLKAQVNMEKQAQEEVQEELKTAQEWKQIASELKAENQVLRENELRVYNESQEQQILTKEALNKLYEFREESLQEKEKMREMYEQYIEDRVEEERQAHQEQVNNLLDLNEKLRNQVISAEGQVSALKHQEALLDQVYKYKAAINKKKQLNELEEKQSDLIREQRLKDEIHKKEVEKLRLQNMEKDRHLLSQELERNHQEIILRAQVDNHLDQSRRLQDIQYENEVLRRDLDHRADILRQSQYRDNLVNSSRVHNHKQETSNYGHLQSQLSNLKFDIEEIKHENRRMLNNLSPYKRRV